ncbi:YoaK family protein [Flavobacterium lacus]|uniref:Uncharacterized membrane protein YoaK (UPF0700 family) n=1 Tax=Flavobacterium lacus TaxID=1353778 RepID=A0A328WL00_9FLAO|nr:YoaK family protein [Flavobacterium lacus]RAR46931.1 uncharacterized membrane protein YoaK (UPF0700 family) [Flavobacterium lacus]
MFRHLGNSRTFKHNIRLATTLSMVAGIVNICGLLALGVLTTNVTGHIAFFSEEIAGKDYATGLVFLLFTMCFLLGAFISNFLTELALKNKNKNPHFYPLLLEIVLITFVALTFFEKNLNLFNSQYIAYALLLAMGIQNALVTNVSKSVVRTTHLTGLLTDLGIDLSQLFFKNNERKKVVLEKNITLRLAIITFFFAGGLIGGILFKYFELKTLLVASALLIMAIYFDYLRFQYYILKRKIFRKN